MKIIERGMEDGSPRIVYVQQSLDPEIAEEICDLLNEAAGNGRGGIIYEVEE